MTQCLVFVLACKMGQIFALCWFWEKKCEDTTKCSTLSISFIQKEIYKKLHASARLPTMCNTLGWSLSARYTTKFLHLGAPTATTQAEISWFWRPIDITPPVESYEKLRMWKMLCGCHCDTCFMGHFGRRIWWNHSFLRLAHLEAKVRSGSSQIRLNRQTHNFHSKSCLYCPVLIQDPKNVIYFHLWL